MKKLIFIHLILTLLLALGCTKSPGKTAAKLKLDLSRIVDVSSGIGSGGAILFGRNHLGNIFGKRLIGSEENLDLPNGNWVFYALMWDSAGGATPMNGKVHCAKAAQQLSGADTSISLNLDNANCADPEFSEGRIYTDVVSGHKRFADVFFEECDVANATTAFSCGLGNQGSGLSYRLKFQSFRKSPTTPFVFEGEPIVSSCRQANAVPSINSAPFPVNFPSGALATPFVVTMEVFLSSVNCDPNDPKGVFQFSLNQGLKSQNPIDHKVLFSTSEATVSFYDFNGTMAENEKKCEEELLGYWTGSTCTTVPATVTRFAPAVMIVTQNVSTPAIKHLFQIPKPFLCGRYIDSSALVGTHPFAGGDGSDLRPYKICSEWQINQIGERHATSNGFKTSSFKLMNDLDMNKADFNAGLRPTCMGVLNSIYDHHHNFNPFDQATLVGCTAADINATPGYSGKFNGNNKTIYNARINIKSATSVGMIRSLAANGQVKDLSLVNLEVSGAGNVGGIAGYVEPSSNAKISNIKMKNVDIESNGSTAGAVVGMLGNTGIISGVKVHDGHVRGMNFVGGLVGETSGLIEKSMFRGELDQYNSQIGGYIGGVSGNAGTSSMMDSVFSEGSIKTSLQFAGGIAGHNMGSITNAYSNMYIASNYQNADARIGGIVGFNETGAVSAVYSDSILKYTGGGATPGIDGISAQGTPPSNCFSTGLTTASGCTALTFVTLRDGTHFGADINWKADIGGTLPRLAWEAAILSRPCLLAENLAVISSQIGAGRGSAANPIVLCNSAQVKSLGAAITGQYFKLAEDISLADWTNLDMVPSFAGILDGNDRAFYGLNINSVGSNNHAIFKANSGIIFNLNVVGNKLVHSSVGDTGILVGSNAGMIKKVYLLGNEVDGVDNVGVISGSNSGSILDSSADDGVVRGQSYVGGIVGVNSGAVTRVASSVSIRDLASYPNYFKFGGVAGYNNTGASIDQALFDGRIEMQAVSGMAGSQIYTGGLVGYNGGAITNSMTKNYSTLWVKNTEYIGGLVGVNAGSIATSIALGKVVYANGIVPIVSNTFNPIVGFNNGGTIAASNYYLANNIGTMLSGNQQVSNCSIISLNQSCTTLASFDVLAANFFDMSYGSGGDTLTAMVPIITPFSLMVNGDLTTSTYMVTVPSSAGILPGMSCQGTGIPVGAYVVTVPDSFTVQLNIPVGMTAAGVPLSFTDRFKFDFVTADNGGVNIMSNQFVNFYAGHTPANTTGAYTIGSFGNFNIYSGYDMAYDSGDPATSIHHDRLMEYHKAMMDNRLPNLPPPIWEMEPGRGPRLVQIEH